MRLATLIALYVLVTACGRSHDQQAQADSFVQLSSQADRALLEGIRTLNHMYMRNPTSSIVVHSSLPYRPEDFVRSLACPRPGFATVVYERPKDIAIPNIYKIDLSQKDGAWTVQSADWHRVSSSKLSFHLQALQ